MKFNINHIISSESLYTDENLPKDHVQYLNFQDTGEGEKENEKFHKSGV
jgi:hypothetical protein